MEKTQLDPTRPATASTDTGVELSRLGNYRLLRKLGEGGMGSVYLGYDERQDQHAAIKILADGLNENQSFIDRFYREARSGAQLSHPNIVRSLAVGQDQPTGKHYLVLEYVDGPNAQTWLETHGSLPIGDAVHVALDIARALEHAHSRNIVHRDIKPDNILLARTGMAKLSDLGLAKRTDVASHLTATRQGFGTTAYMPYEQAVSARNVDGRSDIYALGATLYHLVTGQVPFPGASHLEIVELKHRGDFTPAGELNPAVPRALDRIIQRMLACLPTERYQTASELIVDLERSQLAARVPGYADPDKALQDPLVRARLSTPTQQTRMDLEARRPTPSEATPIQHDSALEPDVWVLRYRNKAGRLCKSRVNTTEIVERLRNGRLPREVEARRQSGEPFRALEEIAEFRESIDQRRQGMTAQAQKSPAERSRYAILVFAVLLVGMMLGVLAKHLWAP